MDLSGSCRKEVETSDRESEISRGSRTPRNKEPPVGILRLDIGKPRRSSVEFKYLSQVEPSSPQPSIDRLSVTFAEDSVKSDLSTKCNLFNLSTSPVTMEKVHFPPPTDEENSDDEDYSASVTAIMQRRASTNRSKRRMSRRTSSPFSPDILPGAENGRRRSSCYTTSSGDTAITMDDNISAVTQEQIFENIRLHKEVLSNVKMQPWPMRKKLRLVNQAKSYVKKHEGVLQERLAQSRSTKDILARWNIYWIKKWQHIKREAANLSNWVIPWELRIKEIESHFGSVVASYFTFLRWLFWVNLVTSIILIAFVAVPELLIAKSNAAAGRKLILEEERYNATNFLTLWDFEGILKYSPLFYGWYTDKDVSKGYRLPLAYFMTGLVVYVYSFVATLRKMAENSRMSKLSEKEDECIFSWKLFTSWDYMIGNAETAHNRVASIVMGFKEALLEEAEKKREKKKWKIIAFRVLVNLSVIALLVFSAFAVVEVVRRSTEPEAKSNIWRMNEITIVMILISTTFPMIFEVLGLCEQYHPRKQLRLQLARIMLLNLLNLYSLIFALFDKINDMQIDLQTFKPNQTNKEITSLNSETELTGYKPDSFTNCEEICPSTISELKSANLISVLLVNMAATILPNFSRIVNYTTTKDWTTELTNTWNNLSSEPFSEISNTSFQFNNATEWDFVNVSESSYLPTSAGEEELDFEESFQQYLDYVLSKWPQWKEENNFNTNNSEANNTTIFPTITPYFINDTDTEINISLHTDTSNLTSSYTESYEYFKTTLSPYFNMSLEDFDERFETEYVNIFDNLTTTIQSLEDNITDSNCILRCEKIPFNITYNDTSFAKMDYKSRSKLRSLCWETMFGQELVKLTVMDLVMTIISTLAMDFFRGVFVRVMNNCWCWDLEKKFPQYGDFKVAENILHLVNNQGMVWMGMFFSPGLVVLNVFKLYIMVYFRSWAVLTCNVPHKVVFRASRSNNFYYALLLSMLFLCVLPVGYAIVWVRPSWHCGPFSKYRKIFFIFTTTLRKALPTSFHKILDYIASPGIVIPLLVLMILIIYYLISLSNALREANNDLKIQLRRERTEERRKMFQIVDRRRRVGSEGSTELAQTPFGKWKKLLHTLPGGKSFDETPKQESEEMQQKPVLPKTDAVKTRDFFSKFIKRALRKSSVTSEDDSIPPQDDGSDTEQHDSLPEDMSSIKEVKPQVPSKIRRPFTIKVDLNSSFRKSVHTAIQHKREKADVESIQKGSFDFGDKRVQIKEHGSDIKEAQSVGLCSIKKRRDSFELKKRKDKRRAYQSPSRSSSSKEVRQDSLTSTWSENIPVITISKTESSECILEHQAHKHENENSDVKFHDNSFSKKLTEINEHPTTSSTDTLVTETIETKPKSVGIILKNVSDDAKDLAFKKHRRSIEKQETVEEDGCFDLETFQEQVSENTTFAKGDIEQLVVQKDTVEPNSTNEDITICENPKKNKQKSTNGDSTFNSDSKTESSNDYKDTNLS